MPDGPWKAAWSARGGKGTVIPTPNPVLTREEVAAWLKVKPRQVQRLGIPCVTLGRKTKRYFARDVLAWLETHRS